jgi:hypothetical protein
MSMANWQRRWNQELVEMVEGMHASGIMNDAAYEKICREMWIRGRLAYLDALIKRFGWKV